MINTETKGKRVYDGAEGRRTLDKDSNQAQFFVLGSRSWRLEPGLIQRKMTQVQKIELQNNYRVSFPQKETTATAKERSNLLVEVKAKIYCSLITMTRKFLKYGQEKRI